MRSSQNTKKAYFTWRIYSRMSLFFSQLSMIFAITMHSASGGSNKPAPCFKDISIIEVPMTALLSRFISASVLSSN